MTRVAYVSSHEDFVGGGEYSLFDLMTHLPADIEPVLVVPGEGELAARAESEGLAWRIAPMPPIGWRAPAALWHWRGLLRDIRPDILHANNSRAAFYAGAAGRMFPVPMLFHCRVNRPDPRLDGVLMRLARGVIVNSHATAVRFHGRRGLPLWVVHNGLDVSPFEEAGHMKPQTKPFGAGRLVLMVARVSRLKRHDLALDVFERIGTQLTDAHLVFIGDVDDTDWRAELERRQDGMPNADRIHWIGAVDQRELACWYAAADVLLLPSDYESFGRVLVEAMAAGVPPVAFAVGGVPEVVEDGRQGVLVSPGDVDAMAAAVQRLLENNALRRQMGEEGRKRARLFTIERHVERICGIYREVLA